MAEQVDLTVPKPSVLLYRVAALCLDWDNKLITITLRANNLETFSHQISGATATTLMNQLNTMNMTTTSLHKRILNRLITDGVLAGTVSGSPD